MITNLTVIYFYNNTSLKLEREEKNISVAKGLNPTNCNNHITPVKRTGKKKN